MPTVTLDAARSVKAKVMKIASPNPNVVSLGIGWAPNGEYAVVVALEKDQPTPNIPPEIDGVTIITRVVGKIQAQTVLANNELG